MTQTATAAAPPPAAPASPATAPAVSEQSAPAYVDTPRLLNRWQLIGMSVAILFGIVSALVQFLSWQADGRAADDTEQLVRVQEIQSSLLRADALATNAFLLGGLEDPDKRAEYDAAVESVLRLTTAAADAQPADREALSALNVEVTDYATAVAQARDNSRQGFPVGAEYLSEASTELRSEALPILKNLVRANTDRAEGAMAAQHPIWLFLLGVAVLVLLVWLNRELARHFRRRINKGVAVAAAIVLGVTVVTAVLAWARDSSNDDLLAGDFKSADSQANARTAANDAKANESLRLIKRGSGAAFEDKWQEAAEKVDKSLARPGVGENWQTYLERHQEIVDLDENGDWEGAVALATNSDDQSSTAPFDAFDADLKKGVAQASEATTDDLRSGRVFALLLSGLTLLLGIGAAVAVARGIGERRREFA